MDYGLKTVIQTKNVPNTSSINSYNLLGFSLSNHYPDADFNNWEKYRANIYWKPFVCYKESWNFSDLCRQPNSDKTSLESYFNQWKAQVNKLN